MTVLDELGVRYDEPLQGKHSLQFDVRARWFLEIDKLEQIRRLITGGIVSRERFVVLGGGSNVLFAGDYDGLVMQIGLRGRTVVKSDDEQVIIDVAGGESWPELVAYVVENGWGGIENLALIPGTAGAAPVQNIAAYGHSLHDSLVSVTLVDLVTGALRTMTTDQCRLGYRDSLFKHELKNRCVIVNIRLRLAKRPRLNTSYRSRHDSLNDELARLSPGPYTVKDVYQAVGNLRRRKLPDVGKVGTAGSFFKNPVIARSVYEVLVKQCPGIHCYPAEQLVYPGAGPSPGDSGGQVKVPAAWLIQELGLAGYRCGGCLVWPSQPLNLVNDGTGSPAQMLELMSVVTNRVKEAYGIDLEPEVQLISSTS